ncbi:S41 family peptidase [Pedobacter punctiformis]|uniref:S41 family peptidase n=1 Tax=Pedobacter punctiformis TaxID=3004097 RepID=A0ABT4LCL0_9SPHI|nr:S41 family peptidase [Pedobacter sp. HCMS5-2]MCZ4244893.1 S41 family peptidase [Pedobacter sp. HCMS5-2]
MKKYILFVLLLFFIQSAFAQTPSTTDFFNDLEYLQDTLPKKHKNLFIKINKSDFENKIKDIKLKVNDLNYETFTTELFKLIVSIGDEHTRIEPPYTKILPIQFDIFKEGIFVVGIDSSHAEHLKSELTQINGQPIKLIIDRFKQVIQSENKSYFEVGFLNFLNNPAFLKGLDILNSNEEAQYTFKNPNGKETEIILKSILKIDKRKIQLAKDLYTPYSSEKNGNYWFQYNQTNGILYFNYSRCKEDQNNPFAKFNEALFKEIKINHPKKIVLDLRENSGGNSGILWPFIDSIKTSYLNKEKKLFVLIGKRTFSSALMNAVNLKRNTNAKLIGESTSGNINHYGEVRGFKLPKTKIIISYSTKYWENWKGKKGPLLPDVKITYSIENFKKGKDEAIEYIYKQ